MPYDISTRLSLRWVPDEASEPTDTLVYNVGSYFMDLRVLKSDKSIDWAMAGERHILSQDPVRCRWIKMIDSLGPSEPDEGTFTTLPNGDSLETGSMPYPEKGGAITDYEEVWRDLKPRDGVKWAWILHSVDGKTFLGRIGGGYMALRQADGKAFAAIREEWRASWGWSVQYAIGDTEGVPSLAAIGKETFDKEETWKIGHNVEVLGQKYVVLAWEEVATSA